MEKPTISCVWVHHAANEERSELAQRSLLSLLAALENYPAEVCVVDNGGSCLFDSQWLHVFAHEGQIATYIRNASNVSFGAGRNQAIQNTHADFILISDDDILYPPDDKWVKWCLAPFFEYPEKRMITSPFRYTDERPKFRAPSLGKYERHLRAGSNCFFIRRTTFDEVGLFKLHRISGSLFTDSLVRAGYSTVIVPRTGIVDAGLRRGYGHHLPLKIEIPLTDGSVMKIV